MSGIAIIGTLKDPHTLGPILIKEHLWKNSYISRIVYDELPKILEVGRYADLIIVSTVNGEAYNKLFNENIEKIITDFKSEYNAPIWLGSNLHHSMDPQKVKSDLSSIGFDLVIPKGISEFPELPEFNNESFYQRLGCIDLILKKNLSSTRKLSDDLIPDGEVEEVLKNELRKRNLEYVSPDEMIRFKGPLLSELVQEKKTKPLIQVRTGVSSVFQQHQYWQKLKDLVDVMSIQIDSNTRLDDINLNSELLNSESALNGYPLLNHPLYITRELFNSVPGPKQIRHGASPVVSLLLAHHGFASGASAFEGGAMSYTLPYHADVPLEDAVYYWQLTDRLAGILTEKGYTIDREIFGPLTGTLVPPEMALAVNVMESLLAASQGVKSISVGYGEQGNRVQDIAALHLIKSSTRRFLDYHGFNDVRLSSVFHQYMGAFPSNPEKAAQIIKASATTAYLAGADRLIVKTISESSGIPDLDNQMLSIELCKKGMRKLHWQYNDRLYVDYRNDIWNKFVGLDLPIWETGEGNLSKCYVNAVRFGIIDIPFAPHPDVKGVIRTKRDNNGAVKTINRIVKPDNEYNKDLAEDSPLYGIDKKILKGEFKKWPLDGHYDH